MINQRPHIGRKSINNQSQNKRNEIPRIPQPWRESIDIPIEFPNDSVSFHTN